MALLASASANAGAAGGVRIEGLPTTWPLEGLVREHLWEGAGAVLHVDPVAVRVSPWPRMLGRRLVTGYFLKGSFTADPDGPSMRLELTPPDQRAPVLVVGSRTPRGTPVFEGWILENGRLGVSPRIVGNTKGSGHPLRVGHVTRVRQGTETWCVQLLAIHPASFPEPGISEESPEPRFDWVAARTSGAACVLPVR